MKKIESAATIISVILTLMLSSCAGTQPSVINNYYYEIYFQLPAAVQTESSPEQPAEPATEQVSEIVAEPVPEETPVKEAVVEPVYEIGSTGPAGGIVFMVEDSYFEMAQPVYETSSYEDALHICESFELNGFTDWKLPSVSQLAALYTQLYDTFLIEIDETYYWTCDATEDSAFVMYFGTGFESLFFRNMDFVSLIPVREILL